MIRAYMDNVILKLDPLEKQTDSGIVIQDQTSLSGHRMATVVASGPGYHTPKDVFIPNESRPGDRVLIHKLAGQNYELDFTVPRHNKSQEFQELLGESGEFRIVREQEILAFVDEDEDEDAAEAAE